MSILDERRGHRDYLGVGWKFPLRVDASGGLSWSRYEESVAEAIWILLGTARGERQMRPRLGVGIHDYVFANIEPSTTGDVAMLIGDALSEWEPRIDVLNVRVEPAPGEESKLLVHVDYRIRSNNAFHNVVYPFWVREGGVV